MPNHLEHSRACYDRGAWDEAFEAFRLADQATPLDCDDLKRLGIAAYLVPFIFALHPALIFIGTAKEIVIAIVTASIGVVMLSAGCAGYLFRPLSWSTRGMLWLASVLLLLPSTSNLLLFADFAGLAMGATVVAWEWIHCRPRPQMLAE